MNDTELKSALTETWPIRPGQESRAWGSLQARLQGDDRHSSLLVTWPRLLALGSLAGCLMLIAFEAGSPEVTPLSAASQSPGIFATAFYSQPAKAQVVWLNGMDPATDGPTYMDPTTKVDVDSAPAPSSPAKADRL
jgi:hypothetical protein